MNFEPCSLWYYYDLSWVLEFVFSRLCAPLPVSVFKSGVLFIFGNTNWFLLGIQLYGESAMEDRENSDPQRSDQEDLVKDEDNCWSQENVDRAVRTFVSICLGEERPYEYNINQQRARDADSREQTVQTATLNPLETQSHVQASAGDSREKHTQGLCGDDSRTAENDFTKDNSRGAASRTVCDLGQRGHYVKAVCFLYNEVLNTWNYIQWGGGETLCKRQRHKNSSLYFNYRKRVCSLHRDRCYTSFNYQLRWTNCEGTTILHSQKQNKLNGPGDIL